MVGALWDYKGHFSNLDWQPAALDAASDHITMCVYLPEDHPHYLACFSAYTRAEDCADARRLLQNKGYTLHTLLYKLPS